MKQYMTTCLSNSASFFLQLKMRGKYFWAFEIYQKGPPALKVSLFVAYCTANKEVITLWKKQREISNRCQHQQKRDICQRGKQELTFQLPFIRNWKQRPDSRWPPLSTLPGWAIPCGFLHGSRHQDFPALVPSSCDPPHVTPQTLTPRCSPHAL